MANRYVNSSGSITAIKEDNFGYRLLNKEVIIPLEQEMIISDSLEISEDGCLDIQGIFTVLGA